MSQPQNGGRCCPCCFKRGRKCLCGTTNERGGAYSPGTRVQYTNAWLYSTGQAPTGDACRYRGSIVDDPERLGEMDPERFVVVEWDHDPEPMLVNAANVAPLCTAKLLDIPLWVNRVQGMR